MPAKKCDELQDHIATASGNETKPNSYMCNLCSKKFARKFTKDRHMKTCEGPRTSKRKTYTCHLCFKRFVYKFSIERHMQTCEREGPNETEPRSYMCSFCSRSFTSKFAKERHLSRRQLDKCKEVTDPIPCSDCPDLRCRSCHWCFKKFASKFSKQRHMIICLESKIKCEKCNTFSTPEKLLTHANTCPHSSTVANSLDASADNSNLAVDANFDDANEVTDEVYILAFEKKNKLSQSIILPVHNESSSGQFPSSEAENISDETFVKYEDMAQSTEQAKNQPSSTLDTDLIMTE